jgi:glycerol-3-phosphate acyltransferase PlsX
MNIAIDIFGGDYAPREVTRGIAHFFQHHTQRDVVLFLTGPEEQISRLLAEYNIPSNLCRIVHAPLLISMDETSAKAFLNADSSSMFRGLELLKNDQADVFITAGNSAALVAGVMKYRLSGNQRPVAPAYIPQLKGGYAVLADVGLNIDCSPDYLNHFAEILSDHIHLHAGIRSPKIALLNIGKEATKGNKLARAAYEMLDANPSFNFIGNIEGNDIINNKADGIICDGYSGNIVLKLLESFSVLDERFSFEQYGGSVLLGTHKPIILGHGRSGYLAFSKMLEQAAGLANQL